MIKTTMTPHHFSIASALVLFARHKHAARYKRSWQHENIIVARASQHQRAISPLNITRGIDVIGVS